MNVTSEKSPANVIDVHSNDQQQSNQVSSVSSISPIIPYDDKCKVISLDDLIFKLRCIFQEDTIDVDYVQKVMASYNSNPRDWRKYCHFDRHRWVTFFHLLLILFLLFFPGELSRYFISSSQERARNDPLSLSLCPFIVLSPLLHKLNEFAASDVR